MNFFKYYLDYIFLFSICVFVCVILDMKGDPKNFALYDSSDGF